MLERWFKLTIYPLSFLFLMMTGIRTPNPTYIMHSPYQLSQVHDSNLSFIYIQYV